MKASGRRSFNNFNAEVQGLEAATKIQQSNAKEQKDMVSDDEMANRYKNNQKRAERKRKEDSTESPNPSPTAKKTKEDWSQHPGRTATRFAAGKFVRPQD